MKIDDLKEKLDDETFEQLNSFVDGLIGQRDAARQESISGRKGLKQQVEQLTALKTALFDKLGIEEEADIDSLPDAKGQADALRQYEVKLKRMERELTDKTQALTDIQTARRKDAQRLAINDALKGQEFTDPEVAELLIANKIEWDGDELFYKTDRGLVPLVDGVKLLTEQKPHLLKAVGTAGSGHRSTSGAGGIKNPFSKDSFNLTEQIQMKLENPQLAEQLRASASD
jgi:hypothetical protein